MALVDRYIAAHKALRPRGVIWEIRPGSVTEREIRIEAEQLAEIHQSVDDLIKEADLRQVFHLLEEWENVFELPHTGTYEERLAALNAADSEGVLPRNARGHGQNPRTYPFYVWPVPFRRRRRMWCAGNYILLGNPY